MFRLILAFALFSLFSVGVNAAEKLLFSGIRGSVNTDISMRVLKEAYKKLDIEVEVLPLPGARALQSSNSGKVDGEVFRIVNVHKKFKNLIPVPTPINTLQGIAFSKNKKITVEGWESLKNHKTGIQVGIKFAERGTDGMKRTIVDTNEQLFKMLAANRIDVAVAAYTNGIKTIKNLKLTSIHALTPPLQEYPLYHYLHRKNAHLVNKLDAVLQTMKKSGRIQQIRKQTLEEFKLKE